MITVSGGWTTATETNRINSSTEKDMFLFNLLLLLKCCILHVILVWDLMGTNSFRVVRFFVTTKSVLLLKGVVLSTMHFNYFHTLLLIIYFIFQTCLFR